MATGRGIAVGLLTLAVLAAIKLLFLELFDAPTSFLLFFAAVVAAAWYGGWTAGVVTTAVAGVIGDYIFMTPTFELSGHARAIAQTAMFCVEGVVLTLVTSRLRHALRAAEEASQTARTAADKLAAVLSGVDEGITMQDASGRMIYANDVAAGLNGFTSPEQMLAIPLETLAERFELMREDGSPLPRDALPSRALARGETAPQLTIRHRNKSTGEERWSLLRANAVRDDAGALRFVVNVFQDVTEKRRQDAALLISQTWFATALRSIGDAVVTTDRRGHVTFLNPVAQELTGWSSAAAEGRPLGEVFRIFDETTHHAAESPVDRVLREGVVVGLANHTVLRRRDGREIPIDDSAAPIKADDGELVGVVLVFRDVTAERREEARRAFLMRVTAELGASLDYSNTLASVARLAVPTIADWCAVDMIEDGQLRRLGVAHVDPAKIRFVTELERRYPPDPHAPTGVPNVLRTGQPEMMAEIPAQLFEAAAVDAEHLRLLRELALHSYICVPITLQGRTVGAISLVMAESNRSYGAADLEFATNLAHRASVAIENAASYREAQRLRAEAAFERDRLQAMIAAAPIAIAVLRGPDLVFDMMNEPYRKRIGDAAIGAKLSDLNVDPENFARLQGVYATGVPVHVQEQEAIADYVDGVRKHYVTYSIQPLRGLDGQVDSIASFVHDVTDQVTARQRVDAARAEAELASRSKDEFLAMLGHELRNPLAPIVTALQLMNLRADGALTRERSIIERQVKHVVRLVDDLLDVSRITRGRVDLAKELVDIEDVIARALEVSSPLVEQRAHQVSLQVGKGLLVYGDPTRLAQVVSNVVTNAAKYTEKGGHIAVRAARELDEVVVAVEDNGIGIAPDMLPRVFEMFTQERQALDRAQGGLGLGLAIVRSLVTLHGGTVEARSEGEGKGTEVVIRLPVARTSSRPLPAPPALSGARVAGAEQEKVLLVDDNADALDLLGTALDLLGYPTVEASDGPQALITATRERPTIALLDIGLPVMNGYELARRLREISGLEHLQLIAITGYGQPSDRERAVAAGFDDHLVKPVTMEAVKQAIDRLKARR